MNQFSRVERDLPSIIRQEAQLQFDFESCGQQLEQECLNIIIELSSSNKKIGDVILEMKLQDSKVPFSSKIISGNLSKKENKEKIKNAMDILYKKLFNADISYTLGNNIELFIDDSMVPSSASSFSVPKGKVNFKFQYRYPSKKTMYLYSEELIISNSFDIKDQFEDWNRWKAKEINYIFFTDKKWSGANIKWDTKVKNKFDPIIKDFKDCPNYSCHGSIIDKHELVITQNGYKPLEIPIEPLDTLRGNYYIDKDRLMAKRIEGNLLNYAIPGWGFYNFGIKKNGYYQTDMANQMRGGLYTALTAIAILYIADSRSNVTSSKSSFDEWKKIYKDLDPSSPQDEYNVAYSNMVLYENEYIKNQNKFYTGLGVMGAIYSANFIEISILFGKK